MPREDFPWPSERLTGSTAEGLQLGLTDERSRRIAS